MDPIKSKRLMEVYIEAGADVITRKVMPEEGPVST